MIMKKNLFQQLTGFNAFLLLTAFLALPSFLQAQINNKITAMEYRWDNQPPVLVDMDPDTSDTDMISQTVSTAGLSEGEHRLYVRFQGTNGLWGPTRMRKVIIGSTEPIARRMTKVRYYWSDNPGTKYEADLPATMDTSLVWNLTSSDGLPTTPGTYTLYVQFASNDGIWGPVKSRKVLVGTTEPIARRMTKVRYYWSDNPGTKYETDLPATMDTSLVWNLTSSDGLPTTPGTYTLYVQFASNNGIWGPVKSRKVVISQEDGTTGKIVCGEYFWARDRNSVYNFENLDSSEVSLMNYVLSGVAGSNVSDTLLVRFRDSRGIWSAYRSIPVMVDAGMAPPVIAGGEYYFNNPVTPGTGIPFGGTFGSTTANVQENISVASTGLGLGLHTVYARFRNDRGEWGAALTDTFRIRIKPVIVLSRTAINFGTVAVNDSVAQNFSIRNNGDDTLKITGISISPSGLGYGCRTSADRINPGSNDSIVVTVWLKPTSEGAKNATLTVNNNDATQTVALTANAVINPYPTITVSIDSLAYKGVQVGRDSVMTFHVSNTGTTAFNITNIASNHSAFTVVSPTTFPVPVNIGSPRMVQIKFTPTGYIQYRGVLTITNTSDNNPTYTLNMSGEGTTGPPARTIVVSPDTVDFGLVTKDSTQTRLITIGNTGNSTLSVTSATVGHAAFTVLNPPGVTNPLVIAADSTRFVVVQFRPTVITSYASTLTIQSDATNTPTVTRVIRGTGVAGPTPNIFLSTSLLNFGTLKVGQKDTLAFTLTNTGNANLIVNNILSSNANVFRILSSTSFTLVPSASQDVIVEFAPLTGTVYSGNLTVKSNTNDAVVNVQGTGAELAVGLNPGSVNPTGNPGSAVPIVITPSAPILWAKLYFKTGGSINYDSVSMSPVGGGSWAASIPSLYVTNKGVSYYVAIGDGIEIKTAPSVNPQQNPYTVFVNLSSGLAKTTVQPAGNQVEHYRMISLPIDVTQGDADSVLSNFGPADINVWRLFRWQGTTVGYIEHYDDRFENFAPGRGYWFITTKGIALRTGPGKTVSTSGPFSIAMQNGWNMIGNPFNFNVPWDSVSKTTQIQTPYTYDDDGSGKITYIPASVLEPWKGYFVKSTSANPVNIGIPPIQAPSLMAKPFMALPTNVRWMLQIKASSGTVADNYNYIGVSGQADDGWDPMDMIDAPKHPGDYVKLSIPHPEWSLNPDEYGADIRKDNEEGQVWDFEVSARSQSRELRLEFESLKPLPPEWDAVLLDKDLQMSVAIKDKTDYAIPVGLKETVRRFRLIAGKTPFIKENDLGLSVLPQRFYLGQNFPNPFNPSTALKYALPAPAHVTIKIYNALGQQVCTLIEQDMPAGYHIIRWNGTNHRHQAVSTGIYICRMTAVPYDKTFKTFSQSRKLILLK